MILPDRMHCPDCQGRLSLETADWRCGHCGRTVPIQDGIADFAAVAPAASERLDGITRTDTLLGTDLPNRLKLAAAERWPANLGDTIEFGCGAGLMAEAIANGEIFHSLMLLDSDAGRLRACRERLGPLAQAPERPVLFATAMGTQNVIRDAVADTVVVTAALDGLSDTRDFLRTVYRVLRPRGRALLIVPNRRFHQVLCLALADVLCLRYAQNAGWPPGTDPLFRRMAELRRLMVYADQPDGLRDLSVKHLFDTDALRRMGLEIGFSSAETLPLDPDPTGASSFIRLCAEAGAEPAVAQEFGALASAVGRPLLELLRQEDAAAYTLLWLTKAGGPAVRIYPAPPPAPPTPLASPDLALGGLVPRWSIELLAQETEDGIGLRVSGWCFANVDVLWVRLTLEGVTRVTPIWRSRPDVHEVLNRDRQYHALYPLCSGLDDALLFEGARPVNGGCAFRMEILLAGGLRVAGPAPERLMLNEQTVVAH